MDKPADPATPFDEVYQSFLDDLALEGRKPSTIDRYRYNIVRFEGWLTAKGHPASQLRPRRARATCDWFPAVGPATGGASRDAANTEAASM